MTVARILADPDYPALKKYVLDHTGLEYYLDKDEDFAARIARRFAEQRIETARQYLARLAHARHGRPEMEALIGELTIGETYFFRQREHFHLLRDRVFPELFERNASTRAIRAWSAGCATGAEPYSMSILLRLELSEPARGWDVSILGTDINPRFLARAQEARYEAWAFRETPENIRQRCFRQDGRQWVVRPEFREGVSFEYHNLATQPAPPGGAPFDIILCRNVMIYFGWDMARRVVANFHDALSDGGWLLVGHAEPNFETFARFEAVYANGAIAYRKGRPSAAPPVCDSAPVSLSAPRARRAPARTPAVAAPRPPAERKTQPATVEDARVLADRGNWSAAEVLCRDVIAADPLNAAAHFTLGLVLEHERALAEAERSLRRAIYLDRSFALAHYHLGICLQLGNPALARKTFENVLRLLDGRPADEVVPHGDGITAGELREMAKMHLEVLGGR